MEGFSKEHPVHSAGDLGPAGGNADAYVAQPKSGLRSQTAAGTESTPGLRDGNPVPTQSGGKRGSTTPAG